MKDHDKIASRLGIILTELNNGKKLNIKDLANEFNVSVRTIQRDLNDRLGYLPLKNQNGVYWIDEFYLGKIKPEDIKQFAIISGIAGMFPSLSIDFLKDLLDGYYSKAYLVKSHNYEEIKGYENIFKILNRAIIEKRKINFSYKDKEYSNIEPYKLLNNKGVWYLCGYDFDKIKTFHIKSLRSIVITDEKFNHNPEIELLIEKEDSIWFGIEKKEVLLKVSGEISDYFKRRKLVPNQEIIEEFDNKEIIVLTKINHNNEIVPIIKYWIPHIMVLKPYELQKEIEEDLREYLKRIEKLQESKLF